MAILLSGMIIGDPVLGGRVMLGVQGLALSRGTINVDPAEAHGLAFAAR